MKNELFSRRIHLTQRRPRMSETEHNDERNEPPPGSRLTRALGGLRKQAVFIPAAIDQAVVEQAKSHLARIKVQRARWQRAQWLAVATCVALAVVIAQTVLRRNGGEGAYVREDLNRDGRVDILDAFQLAREIQKGTTRTTSGDFNGDGKVDRADTEILAKRAVSLEKGGRS